MKMTKLFCQFLCLALVMSQASTCPAFENPGTDETNYEEVQILKGDVYTVPAENLSRVSVTDPTVADINNAKPKEVTVVGKDPGQTALFIWDDKGKRTIMIRVVEEDPGLLKTRLVSLVQSAGLEGIDIQENYHEGKVILTGTLPEDKLPILESIVEPFSNRVINFVKKDVIKDLIQIDMQITELNTTLNKEMGIDWTTGTQTLGSDGTLTTTSGSDTLSPTFGEAMPKQDGSIGDMFKIGKWFRSSNSALVAKINALIKEGKAKVLSKPRLVVVNGKEASFLVGGEVPIRTTTTNSTGGSVQQNVEFKEYGVSLALTPTIKEDGKVDVRLNVEISDIDASKPTGSDVAFVTRSAQTQLLLDDHQTIVLAGLIKHNRSVANSRVPLLGSIPVVGLLFRSKKTPAPDTDTEIVISLTPTILRSSKKDPATPAIKAASAPAMTAFPTGTTTFSDTPLTAAPVLTKNAAGLPVTVPANIEPYARTVQEKISSSIAYPYEAQENGWQGTVKLSLVIRKDGSLRDVMIRESSGYDVFDKDAMNTAQILAPYNPFPESITDEQLTVTIPIVYNLDSFLKNVAKHN